MSALDTSAAADTRSDYDSTFETPISPDTPSTADIRSDNTYKP